MENFVSYPVERNSKVREMQFKILHSIYYMSRFENISKLCRFCKVEEDSMQHFIL